MVAVLAVSALGVLAVPAGAASSTPSPKFCTAWNKISGFNGSGSTSSLKALASEAKRFKTAAGYAPSNVKSAGNTIASVLGKASHINFKSQSDVAKFTLTSDYKKYAKAIATFITFAEGCVTGSVPTT